MATKAMKKEFPEVNYRSQLGIEISRLLKEEKEYQANVTLRVKCLNWMNKYVNHNNTLDSSDLDLLTRAMNIDLNIKRYGFVKSYSKFTLAQEMVKRHPINVQIYA